MILVDTSVIVEFWRKPTDRLKELFRDNRPSIRGVTIAELYHGARSEADLGRIASAVAVFPLVDILPDHWRLLGRNLLCLRRSGVTVPFQDALLAAVAMHGDHEVWTHDGHFPQMQAVLTDLKLFEEPSDTGQASD